jgi:hypothetical protein
MNLPRSHHGMLAHARPSYASKLLTHRVCANGSHFTRQNSIRKRDCHYFSDQVLPLKSSK